MAAPLAPPLHGDPTSEHRRPRRRHPVPAQRTGRESTRTPPNRARRWIRAAVALVAAVAVVWFAHEELPPWSTLATAFRQVDLPLLGVAAAVEAFSLWLFARQQQVLFAGFGVRVPARSALAITYSRSAMSMTFPAGTFVSAAFAVEQYRRFGASRSTAATVTVLSGIVSVLGLGCLYAVGSAAAWAFPQPWQVAAAVLGSLSTVYVAVGFALHRPLPSPKAERTRPTGVVRARLADVSALPFRYWAAGVGYAAANWAADLTCLLVTSAAFGVGLPLVQVGLLYIGIQLLRQVPVSPGGIGVIEAGLVAGLVLLGTGEATATAATLGYRMLSCWLVIPVGLGTWLALSRTSRRV
ncbi:MAG: lysylphosphatidylglycerol synthase transmembrane domain-containing protein [Umezawaea sp.]